MAPDRPGDAANAMFDEYAPVGGEDEAPKKDAAPAGREKKAGGPGKGRPARKDDYRPISLNISAKADELLDAAAYAEGTSRSRVVEELLEAHLQEYAPFIDAMRKMERMREERKKARGK